MTDRPHDPPRDDRAELDPRETAALIDELMAQPIKERPLITVFGDEAVFGINPAPAPRSQG